MCLLTTERRARFPDLFAWFPQVAAHLEGAAPTTAVRGAVTGTRRLARVSRDAVALVGDAAGSVDAITRARLGLTFQQAEHLGAALPLEDLSRYASAHRWLACRPGWMAAPGSAAGRCDSSPRSPRISRGSLPSTWAA